VAQFEADPPRNDLSGMNSSSHPDRYAALRSRMVETQLRARGIADQRVLAALARVPRHEFTDEKYRGEAYEDHPLPIGEGQTISQPYMVGLMLELLAIRPEDRLLEIGTGSGYATAVLAELAGQVFSMERHTTLAERARELLVRLGYVNVHVIVGDGSQGYPASAPYDAILVSAAAPAVPPMLITQLAEGGRMVIPVGADDAQQLQFIHMRNGQPHTMLRELCRFVPLVTGVAP
jgi:protein-L-isoaspartate(D-aspartate) O-methyltransferase